MIMQISSEFEYLFGVLMLLMVSQLESLVCFGDNSAVMLLVTVTVVIIIVCSCINDVSFCHYLTTEYFWRFLLDRQRLEIRLD